MCVFFSVVVVVVVMMVAAVSGAAAATANPKTSCSQEDHDQSLRRPPLLPSEKDNSNRNAVNNPKRPNKSRIVSSRYLSPSPSTSTSNSSSLSSSSSSSRRFPSPLVPRNSTSVSNAASLGPKRSVSVDRRRPGVSRPLTPDLDVKQSNASDVSAATKLLVTCTRSLSVSFQGESFSLPISKTKVAPSSPNLSSVRKGTPERKRTSTPLRGKRDGGGDQAENSKPIDQHPWPARARQANPLSRSLDYNRGERSKVIGSGSMTRTLQQSMMDERRVSFKGRLSLDLGNAEPLKAAERAQDGNSVNNESSVASDLTASDTDSVSSGSTSGVQDSGGASHTRNGPRGIVVSARFWQETNSRLRRLQDPGSPLSKSPGSKLIVPPKLKMYPSDNMSSSPRTMSSPIRGGIRPASPSKFMTPVGSSTPSRGMSSPSRVRNAVSTISNNFSETPSVLSFAVDVRRGKVGENRIFDAHLLRLLYNWHLQWRFVNARTEVALLVQKHSAEKQLWNAWITISDLRDAVTKRRYRLQLLRQKLKLASILKGQIRCLEDWASLDKDHCISLLGAIEALKASTLRLPVGGAIADMQSLKDAVNSAVDVMHAMASSIHLFLPKVEEVNALVMELTKVTAKERALLEQCKDFLSIVAAIEVKDCSLRTHILQHNRVTTFRRGIRRTDHI